MECCHDDVIFLCQAAKLPGTVAIFSGLLAIEAVFWRDIFLPLGNFAIETYAVALREEVGEIELEGLVERLGA